MTTSTEKTKTEMILNNVDNVAVIFFASIFCHAIFQAVLNII